LGFIKRFRILFRICEYRDREYRVMSTGTSKSTGITNMDTRHGVNKFVRIDRSTRVARLASSSLRSDFLRTTLRLGSRLLRVVARSRGVL